MARPAAAAVVAALPAEGTLEAQLHRLLAEFVAENMTFQFDLSDPEGPRPKSPLLRSVNLNNVPQVRPLYTFPSYPPSFCSTSLNFNFHFIKLQLQIASTSTYFSINFLQLQFPSNSTAFDFNNVHLGYIFVFLHPFFSCTSISTFLQLYLTSVFLQTPTSTFFQLPLHSTSI
jgi:hypothetical protein